MKMTDKQRDMELRKMARALKKVAVPVIKVRAAQIAFGLKSSAAATYWLDQLLEAGLIDYVSTGGTKGEWRPK